MTLSARIPVSQDECEHQLARETIAELENE